MFGKQVGEAVGGEREVHIEVAARSPLGAVSGHPRHRRTTL